MPAFTSIPTNAYSNAYLLKAWEERGCLTDAQRKGFAQLFYGTICGHLEAVLSSAIYGRIFACSFSFQIVVPTSNVPHTIGSVQEQFAESLRETMISLLNKFAAESETAPLAKLVELYGTVFGKKLSEVVGAELAKDIDCLGAIRNLFVHGRDFYLEFKPGSSSGSFVGTLDSHPLQQAAQRLHAVGILPSMNFDGLTHNEFRDAFYTDDALRHFYNIVKDCEKALGNASGPHPLDRLWPTQPLVPLP